MYTIALVFVLASASAQTTRNRFSFIAFGDMPYFLPDDYARFDNVIREINLANPVFSIHLGDIKAGTAVCSDEYYATMVGYFNQFNNPLVYTPGDNDWTDCDRKEAGQYDPQERLQKVRSVFYKDNKSFGKNKMELISESKEPEYSKFVENKQWFYNNILFATLHAVGSSNNKIVASEKRMSEFDERNKANLHWLDEIFSNAKQTQKDAIVISTQADMFMVGKAQGFEDIIRKLTNLTIDFGKPVLLINGDSHRFIMDKPLVMPVDPKINKARVVTNFTRLQSFGEMDMHAVKIIVDPSSKDVFQIEQFIIRGN